MDPKQAQFHQLTEAQRAQLVPALEPLMAETLEIEAEEHPISFGDILLRKFGGRYELSVHFWSKDDDSPNLRPYSLYAGVGVPLPHFCFIVPNY